MTVEELIAQLSKLDPNATLQGYAQNHQYDVLGSFVSEDDTDAGVRVVYIDLGG